MRGLNWLLSFLLFCTSLSVEAQKAARNARDFFAEDSIIQFTITTDIRNLLAEKKSLKDIDASVSFKFPDSSEIQETIKLRPRGHSRKEHCYLSSLMLLFNSNPSNKLAFLKNLKMVAPCGKSSSDEQYLLKEYLTYKIYNLLTDLSFRVRLLRVTFNDIRKNVNSFSQYAFLLEDIDAVAKRNSHRQKKGIRYSPAGLQSSQSTLMCIYQYMIGNTDWSIPNYHNVKLVVPREDTNSLPLPVPYDFDMTGLVNPPYAGTSAILGIEKVTDRLYRGFPVTTREVETVVALFLQKEKEIIGSIYSFNLLNRKSKHEMATFLYGFFSEIKNKGSVKANFITNARRQ